MFFFISGFVLYKETTVWNCRQLVKFFGKKIPVQLIAPFIFFLAFITVQSKPFATSIMTPGKAGYWFTFVLLEYYAIYAFVRFCIRGRWANLALVFLGLVLYNIWRPGLREAIPLSPALQNALSIPLWQYFIFFIIGTLAKQFFPLVEKALDNQWLLAGCIIFYFLVNVFWDAIIIGITAFSFLLSISGMVILFAFFRHHQAAFSQERRLGRSLQYIGRRTLDIYLIHYFLIPRNLGSITTIFTDHPMPIIEATVSLTIALIIVGACLLIGNIIRLSPLLAHWVFGAKYTTTQ